MAEVSIKGNSNQYNYEKAPYIDISGYSMS